MKYFLFIFISSFGTLLLGQSTAFTDSVCAAYDNEIQRAIDEEMSELVPVIKINTKTIQRAIGTVETSISLYYDLHEEVIESEEGVSYKETAILRKAIYRVNTGSYERNKTYYFDEFEKFIRFNDLAIGYKCVERSIYFTEDKLKRIVQIPRLLDCYETDLPLQFDKTKFTNADLSMAKKIQLEASKYIALLQSNLIALNN
jgi:hypothetical protein